MCVFVRVCVCVVDIYRQSVRLGAAIAGELFAQDHSLLVYPLARRSTGACCSVSHCIVVCCSVFRVLQHVAVCCEGFPHTRLLPAHISSSKMPDWCVL